MAAPDPSQRQMQRRVLALRRHLTKKHSPRHVLIVGATGIVGRAAVEHFCRDPSWDRVTCVSRRKPTYDLLGGTWLPMDLLDRAACAATARAHLGSVTHAVYGAVLEMGEEDGGVIAGWQDERQIENNDRMMRNFLDALLGATDGGFRHLSFMQGGKAYGAHALGVDPLAVPCKESAPRVEHANFYWPVRDSHALAHAHSDALAHALAPLPPDRRSHTTRPAPAGGTRTTSRPRSGRRGRDAASRTPSGARRTSRATRPIRR